MKNDSSMVLQVFLKSGHDFPLVLSDEVAEQALLAVNQEANGVLSGTTVDGVGYSVRMGEIAALLVQSQERVLQMARQQFKQRQQASPPIPSRLPGSPGTIQFPGPRA